MAWSLTAGMSSSRQLRNRAVTVAPRGACTPLRMQGGEKGPMHDAIDKVSKLLRHWQRPCILTVQGEQLTGSWR